MAKMQLNREMENALRKLDMSELGDVFVGTKRNQSP